MKLVSICIPTYEMHGLGEKFLKHSLHVLANQTFKDFDVVVSDHSRNDAIKDLCNEYRSKLDINYFRNREGIGSSSANINNAIKKARGQIIKIILQDDFFYSNTSLERIVKNFDLQKNHWLVTACIQTKDGANFYRPFYPRYDDKTILKKNTISSPSVLTIKNEKPVFFDENLLWWTDTDYYKRCYDAFGEPKILDEINVVNRIGAHQVSNTMITEALKEREYTYILKKYNAKYSGLLLFLAKMKRYARWFKRMFKKKA